MKSLQRKEDSAATSCSVKQHKGVQHNRRLSGSNAKLAIADAGLQNRRAGAMNTSSKAMELRANDQAGERDELESTTSKPGTTQIKRKRRPGSCDECHARKRRCFVTPSSSELSIVVGGDDEASGRLQTCESCKHLGLACTYTKLQSRKVSEKHCVFDPKLNSIAISLKDRPAKPVLEQSLCRAIGFVTKHSAAVSEWHAIGSWQLQPAQRPTITPRSVSGRSCRSIRNVERATYALASDY